ncbi:hypothetical protein RRG08_008632 [Elysia crispata]|uniref:Uncharacterized protein n=1 Tax=Elysia crispata TaxID=231223 RepID=A0AAE0XYY6_9GAST|nr:hypothetical protein RRG08_008632 [Elysia crispata]
MLTIKVLFYTTYLSSECETDLALCCLRQKLRWCKLEHKEDSKKSRKAKFSHYEIEKLLEAVGNRKRVVLATLQSNTTNTKKWNAGMKLQVRLYSGPCRTA